MKRREFITRLGGAAAAWPLSARAQHNANPTIGFITFHQVGANPHYLASFRAGLGSEGFVEGRNVSIELRWAGGNSERLTEMAADLVRRQVSVIAAPTPPAALAAKRATQAIPIVFTSGSDPVQSGLVANLNRPGGNITGFYFLLTELVAKRLALLRELAPQAKRLALLVNPRNASDAEPTMRHATAAARELGFEIKVFKASTAGEFDAVFADIERLRPDAFFIGPDPSFNPQALKPLIAYCLDRKIPTSGFGREHVVAGCLMSYGPDVKDSYRQAGVYVGRILKGEKPGDLPVTQPTKYEFVINIKTANALAISVLPMLLARADEVIE